MMELLSRLWAWVRGGVLAPAGPGDGGATLASAPEEGGEKEEHPSGKDEYLERTWQALNKDCFEGKLDELWALGWGELSGPNGIGAHGFYRPQSKCIVIDSRFKPDWEKALENNAAELVKADLAVRLLAHEMLHQALHQRNASRAGQHGEAFIDEATRISGIMNWHAPADEKEAAQWPLLGAKQS
jgi:hypothetical protein